MLNIAVGLYGLRNVAAEYRRVLFCPICIWLLLGLDPHRPIQRLSASASACLHVFCGYSFCRLDVCPVVMNVDIHRAATPSRCLCVHIHMLQAYVTVARDKNLTFLLKNSV